MKRENYNVHVSVEPRHIATGQRKSFDKDPIALAINDCLKPQYRGKVAKERRSVISIDLHDQWQRELCQYMTMMSVKAIEFTNAFDKGKPGEPFVFVLTNIPVKMIKGLE